MNKFAALIRVQNGDQLTFGKYRFFEKLAASFLMTNKSVSDIPKKVRSILHRGVEPIA